MRLVDSHAHLQADAFASDLGAVIGAARAAGVERILVPGWDAGSSAAAVGLAREWSVDAAVGVHPHDASVATDTDWAAVVELASSAEVVAIGETGLDYDRMHSPPEAQLANLRRHFRLALDTGKPAILHCRSAIGQRNAQDALIAELRAAGFGGAAARAAFEDRPPAVLHSFSGPLDYAAARIVPAELLLAETDAPYLVPPGVARGAVPGFSGRRNAPEWVRVTAEWLGQQRGQTPDTIGAGLVEAYDATFRRRPGG
jgi:TatD DNase family protein